MLHLKAESMKGREKKKKQREGGEERKSKRKRTINDIGVTVQEGGSRILWAG